MYQMAHFLSLKEHTYSYLLATLCCLCHKMQITSIFRECAMLEAQFSRRGFSAAHIHAACG
jgi:hypothetical protein